MTRGTVVVLGQLGRNLGAGMTGGECFLLDADARLVNDELVALVEFEHDEEEQLCGCSNGTCARPDRPGQPRCCSIRPLRSRASAASCRRPSSSNRVA